MKDQWIEWFQDKQRHFFYGVILVVVAFFLAFQFLGNSQKSFIKDHTRAEKAYLSWKEKGGDVTELTELMREHPALQTQFGAFVAEKFIVQNEGQKAEPFARAVFQRVLSQIPDHTSFAEGSLLIAKGDLQGALNQATSLQARLSQDSLLYGFNLVRIASLNRALNKKPQEISALTELEGFLKSETPAAKTLLECFTEDSTNLLDYIADRKTL